MSDTTQICNIERDGDTVHVRLIGDLDLFTAHALDRRLAEIEGESPQHIIIDLSRVSFLDSTGLHSLLRARQRSLSAGHSLSLSGLHDRARSVLELTRTLEVFTVVN